MESDTIKPRRPWLAVLFSLLGGPLGQVYCGRFIRGIVLWLAILFFIQIPAISIASTLPLERPFLFLLLLLCVLVYLLFMCIDAFMLARRYRTMPRKRYQKWWFYLLFYIGFSIINTGFAHGIKSNIAEAFVIPTSAMSPTIQPGDKVLVDKFWYNTKRMKHNDIVVFHSKGPNSPPFIMRVVGLAGDQIEIKDEQVFVNGSPFNDPHASFNNDLPFVRKHANYSPYIVPEESFFVLGDNRRIAYDSRFFGSIPFSDLIGRANMIYWSCKRSNISRFDPSQYEEGPIAWERVGIVFKN